MEGLVRRIEETDWNQVRARWESRIGTVWAKLREREAGDRFREKAVEAGEEVQKVVEPAQAQESPGPKRLLEIK